MSQKAFTLLELLIVMAILSVMVSIMIPQYGEYRARSFDMRAQADLRNVAIAEEAYFLDSERYLSCQGQDCSALPGISSLSEGVELSIEAGDLNFRGQASHPRGTGKIFRWDTENGGMKIE